MFSHALLSIYFFSSTFNGRKLEIRSAIVSRRRRETIALKISYVFFAIFFFTNRHQTRYTLEPPHFHATHAKKSLGNVLPSTRPKTIHRPLVGCREGNSAYAPRRACAPRAAAEELAWRHRPLGGAERNEHVRKPGKGRLTRQSMT